MFEFGQIAQSAMGFGLFGILFSCVGCAMLTILRIPIRGPVGVGALEDLGTHGLALRWLAYMGLPGVGLLSAGAVAFVLGP